MRLQTLNTDFHQLQLDTINSVIREKDDKDHIQLENEVCTLSAMLEDLIEITALSSIPHFLLKLPLSLVIKNYKVAYEKLMK